MNRMDRIPGEPEPPLGPGPSGEQRGTPNPPAHRTADQSAGKAPASPRRGRLRPILLLIGAAILIGAIILGVSWWQNASHFESTDDAFIDTHIVRIAPQIAGRIVRVDVNDNQLVQPGQLLVEIDAGNATTAIAAGDGSADSGRSAAPAGADANPCGAGYL